MNASPQSDPWIGRLLGDGQRYRLERRLGGGGMGDVFLAADTRLRGRQVALKILKEALVVSEELRKRFEHEVAVCAALSSSHHIVDVRDSGVTPEGHPFYVMEYLYGESLGQLLRREKRLSGKRTVSTITQVCEGLHLAHKGVMLWPDHKLIKVVHRDLKPDNIFLVPMERGEEDLVKILDFGIAKIHSDQADLTNLTTTNAFLGTFHYAAPEQLEVEKDLDERADIYSLGIILYEMLTGTDPFGLGFNLQSVSQASWYRAHIFVPPQPLRIQPDCEQLPAALEAVVLRCLQKLPSERFASVDELSQALKAAVADRYRDSDMTISQLPTSPQEVSDTTLEQPTPPLQADSDVSVPQPSTSSISNHLQPSPVTPGHGEKADSAIRSNSPLASRGISDRKELSSTPPPRKSPFLILARIVPSLPRVLLFSGILFIGLFFSVGLRWYLGPKQDALTIEKAKFTSTNTLSRHSDSVWSIAFSADGQTLASSSGDRTIKTWNPASGKLLHTLSGHGSDVLSVAISLDGKTLASGSKDKTIKLWNLSNGKLLRTLSGHSDAVRSVTFSPYKETLASGSWDKTIKLWNLPSGKLDRTLSGHTGRIDSVAISPYGHALASGSTDKTIKLWNLFTGKPLHTASGHLDGVLSVAFSPTGWTMASGSKDKTVKIWGL